MKVIIDDKIPYIRTAADRLFGQVAYLPGHAISRAHLADADALIVRTRTRCDAQLLLGTSVKMVATATIGYDHLDTAFLDSHRIAWTNCPGCNATSVAQYVRNAMLSMQQEGLLQLQGLRVGIVGAGHVGQAVAHVLRPWGAVCLLNDPPRAHTEGPQDFHSLDELAATCDVITFHTPLTLSGPYATFHLASTAFFRRLRRRPVIINAARGGVVDEPALLAAMQQGLVSHCIVDTWEGEPHVSPALLQEAYLATPHIAGYSADGKANATRMALQAVCAHFGIVASFTIEPPALDDSMRPDSDPVLRELQLYNPTFDSQALKAAPENFEQLRSHYPLRREVWNYVKPLF